MGMKPICTHWMLILGLSLIVLSVAMLISWPFILRGVMKSQLALGPSSTSYKMWKETPIPMYMEMYFFNWTNYDEYVNDKTMPFKAIKPKLTELGPYVFTEKHFKEGEVWNDNGTVTYKQKRVWQFVPEKSTGTLDDQITQLNVIVAAAGYTLRDKPLLDQKAFDILLRIESESLGVTKSARNLIFDGYEDKLIDLMKSLKSKFSIPYDKFGWFYPRNNSLDYDGVFNVYTGAKNIGDLGRMGAWKYRTQTDAYDAPCNKIDGSSGEIWPPMDQNQVDMFISDICSPLKLTMTGSETFLGITGKKYIARSDQFDNGTVYPERKCFQVGTVLPSGVFNISSCRFGAPAFISFPHFLGADPTYLDAVEGMHPSADEHETFLTFEPLTGMPLHVKAQMQINMMIDQYKGIKMFENVPRTLLPCMWFREYALMTEDLAGQAKYAVKMNNIMNYSLGAIGIVGVIFTIVYFALIAMKRWHSDDEVESLLDNSVP